MKKLLILLGAIALTFTLATAENKCGTDKSGKKIQTKCDSAKCDKGKKSENKCDNGKSESSKKIPVKGKCGKGKCGE